MVFHWSLSESKSLQVSTILGILTDISNAVVWMVTPHPPIFSSSSSFPKCLGVVPRARIIIGITVIFMFHNFFSSLKKSKYLCLCDIRPNASILVFLFSRPFFEILLSFTLKMVSGILQGSGQLICLFLWFLLIVWFRVGFSFFWGFLVFRLHLFDDCLFQDSKVFLSFLFFYPSVLIFSWIIIIIISKFFSVRWWSLNGFQVTGSLLGLHEIWVYELLLEILWWGWSQLRFYGFVLLPNLISCIIYSGLPFPLIRL